MTDEAKKNEMNKALFSSLVMMLGSSAMQQLGKLVNPMTNQTEVNLEGAQMTIDMLDMLKDKTRGNLDTDEEKMFTDLLSSLQMNYVQTVQEQKSGGQPEEPETTPEAPTPEDPATEDAPADKDAGDSPDDKKPDPKDPKYHKSYG